MDATSAKCLLTIGGNSIYYVSKFYYFFIPLTIDNTPNTNDRPPNQSQPYLLIDKYTDIHNKLNTTITLLFSIFRRLSTCLLEPFFDIMSNSVNKKLPINSIFRN